MVGYKVNYYWYICWCYLSPAFMLVSQQHSNEIFILFLSVPVLVLLCEV